MKAQRGKKRPKRICKIKQRIQHENVTKNQEKVTKRKRFVIKREKSGQSELEGSESRR